MTNTAINKVALWARILLGVMCLMILGLTVPAFFDPSVNPATATLPAEFATNGSIAGGFLARQFAIAVVGLYAAWKATPGMIMIAAGATGIWNLLEGIFQLSVGGMEGGVAGLVFAAISAVLIWAAARAQKA